MRMPKARLELARVAPHAFEARVSTIPPLRRALSVPPFMLKCLVSQGFSDEAVAVAKAALERGNGSMAQFSHPELGGTGQWMNGMVMIGDAFNQPLKARVAALFAELAQAPTASKGASFSAGSPWWPAEFGTPSQVSGQNDLACACFPAKRCVAVLRHSTVTLYDTGEHTITGVSVQNAQITLHTAAGLALAAETLPEKRIS